MGIGEGRRSAHTGDETAVFGNMHVCMEHGHGDVGTASKTPATDSELGRQMIVSFVIVPWH